MHYGLAVDFGVGPEKRGWGLGDAAYRCGLPFRGNGRPIRDADLSALVPAEMLKGAVVEVAWSPPVSWRKKIRGAKRN